MKKIQKYTGTLMGLAVGDALGAPYEGMPTVSADLCKSMQGGGDLQLKIGEWTDDTAMTLCLAESLIYHKGFDAFDQIKRYTDWYEHGYCSASGSSIGIGQAVRIALDRFNATNEPFSGSSDPTTAGNGSLMRICPIPLAYAHDFDQCIAYAAESSKTTHSAPEAIDACCYYAGLIWGAINGATKDNLLSSCYSPIGEYWEKHPLSDAIQGIAQGDYKNKPAHEIKSKSYVVNTMEAALWCFYNTDTFEEGVIRAITLGYDTDTTGAVYGQLAGAYYGYEKIPSRWTKEILRKTHIIDTAEQLLKLSNELQISWKSETESSHSPQND